MPIYEYQCLSCGKRHEIMQRYTDMPLAKCPACGGHVKKLISNTSFVLKGTGWYKTDYASGTGGTAANGKEGNGSKPETKSESKEVKPNGKPGEKLETVSKTE